MKLIYFDETLINPSYYAGLEKTSDIYTDKKFKLGSTLCETYKFEIDKELIQDKNPSVVYLYDDEDLEKTLYVDNIVENDFTYTFELTDSMINLNVGYDASTIFEDGSTTLGEIFADICDKCNITTDIETFDYSTMEVSWYDNSIMARDYIGYIAELNDSYCYITADNKLVMEKVNSESIGEIDFDEIGKYSIGAYHHITRVVYETPDIHWEYGDETGDTYYVNSSNVFIKDESMVEHIYDYINGFEFYDFKVDNLPILSSIAGKIITFTDGVNSYNTITRYPTLKLGGNEWYGSLEFEVETTKQQETEVLDLEKKVRGIKQTVDRDNNRITTLIEDTTILDRRTSDNETTINNNYQELINKFDGTASTDDITQLRQSMQTTMDEQELRIENIQSILANGVEKVVSRSGTFDENGLTMEKTDAKTKSILDETGIDVKDTQGYSNEDLFFAGYVDSEKAQSNEKLTPYEGQTVVYSRNSIVENYFTIGTHSRIEDYEDGTGVFYIGG